MLCFLRLRIGLLDGNTKVRTYRVHELFIIYAVVYLLFAVVAKSNLHIFCFGELVPLSST